MKRLNMLLIAFFAVAALACSNKDAEKRIAELESRLAELEDKDTSPAVTPAKVETQPEVKPEGPLPVIEFQETEHDFGTIAEGEKVSHTFKFTNTGEVPLIIQNATGSCGCTVPDWPEEPIAPGETGEIVAEYNSRGQKNMQIKTIRITANTWPKQTTLKVKAMVNPADGGAADTGPVRK